MGKRIGRIRWSTSSGKTVEGSLAFLGSLVLAGTSLSMTGIIDPFSVRIRAAYDLTWGPHDD